jgi:RHS repeat-associated protein
MADSTVQIATRPVRWIASLFDSFKSKPARRQKLSLTDRINQVSSIRVSPFKSVGYQGDSMTFSALGMDSSASTVQGVRFAWESSDTDKLKIDNTGEAALIRPGLVRVICRAGSSEGVAFVLIRPGSRRPQTDSEWDADQSSFSVTGQTTGSGQSSVVSRQLSDQSAEGNGPSADSDEKSVVESVIDALAPTAFAQGCSQSYGGDSADFGYDELWSEVRNLTGNPRYRASEGFRLGSILPEGSNFNAAFPIYSLGGRGLGASLTLFYNSRVWSRHGNAVTFNPTQGWPFAGFSLGFGRLFTYGSGSNTKYVWIEPDGTRRYLGVGSDTVTATYQTSDGSHITFVGKKSSGGSLYFNDGTKVTISVLNNRLLPTQIRDANGNYISISYKTYNVSTFPWRQAINYVTDTLGRQLQFNYDSCANLSSITVPAFGSGTNTIAQFDYQNISISNSFSGLTVENWSVVQIPALKRIYFPATGTGYKFDYSAYGMIYNLSLRKDMTYNSQTGAISDGTERAAISFNYPVSASSLTDAPAFSQRTETAINAPTAIYTYSSSTGSGTKTFTITRPDSSQMLLTRSTTGANNGLMTESEIKNSSGGSMAKTTFTYANDGAGHPQIQSVTSYNDAGQPTLEWFEYDQYGNMIIKREYGHQVAGQFLGRRRTVLTYKTDTAYINAYLRSLVVERAVYDSLLNSNDLDDVMIAKTTMTYDDYQAMGGMEYYQGQQMPPNHDSAFDQNYTTRGNVTGTTEYKDIATSQTITHLRKLDIFGNVVKEQLDCCTEREYMRNGENCFNGPYEVRSGTATMQLASTMEEDMNTGLVTSQTDPRGEETTITYDSALRVDVVTSPTTATQDSSYNDSALTSTQTTNWTEGLTNKSATTTYSYDGWGRVKSVVGPNNGQVNTTYDSMGRVWKQTNPFQSGGSPGAETVNTFDALGRVTVVTLPDNQTVQTAYSGNTVTVTDQVNRKMKREADGLGRLVKVYEQTSAGGTPSQETSYTYDLIDRLVEVNQGSQLRKYKYDSMGRLLFEKIPEQSATINDGSGTYWTTKYTYTDYNAVATRQDARGVITTYSYDDLRRMTQVSYNVAGASGVATTPTVTYSYDNTDGSATKGLLLSVSISGQSSESYSYDSDNRLSGLTRTIGTRSYTTGYQYTTANQLTQLTYPSNRAVNINHDSIGRLSSVVNNSDSANYLNEISYNYAGQTTGWTLGSNIAESFGYDSNRLQMTSQTVTQNGQTRMSLSYSYQSAAGQMGGGSTAGNAGQLMSVSGSIGGATESAAYTYDNVGRLVTSNQTSNGVSAQRRFVYDRWGNRSEVWNATSGGSQIQSVSLEQSGGAPTNRITSVTEGSTLNYSYDSAGNVTNDGVHSFTYDAENRVVSVDGGSTASYSYDHQNRRIKRTVGSTTTHYVWQGGQVIAEHNGSSGAVITEYIFAGGRMIAREGGGRTFFLYDRLSVRATITDGQGNIQGRQSHLPFGEELVGTGTTDKHRFTSYERDSETGTDYAVNRQHAQSVGRFSRPDPYDGSYNFGDPQSLNRYTYVRNDPVNEVDPLGLIRACPPGTHAVNGPNGGRCEPNGPVGDLPGVGPRTGGGGGGGHEDPGHGGGGGGPGKKTAEDCRKDLDNVRKLYSQARGLLNALLGALSQANPGIGQSVVETLTSTITAAWEVFSAGRVSKDDRKKVRDDAIAWADSLVFFLKAAGVWTPSAIQTAMPDARQALKNFVEAGKQLGKDCKGVSRLTEDEQKSINNLSSDANELVYGAIYDQLLSAAKEG